MAVGMNIDIASIDMVSEVNMVSILALAAPPFFLSRICGINNHTRVGGVKGLGLQLLIISPLAALLCIRSLQVIRPAPSPPQAGACVLST